MDCSRSYFLTLSFLCLFACSASAEFKTTTEFGITITPDHLVGAIYESQGYWPAVQAHLVSDKFTDADVKTRQQAAAFFKRVNDSLAKRLFDNDESKAEDLLKYLAARLRNYHVMREIRKEVGNDEVFWGLVHSWEFGRIALNKAAKEDQPKLSDELLAKMKQEMAAAKLPAENLEKASKLWEVAVKNKDALNRTQVGQFMIELEDQVRNSDKTLRDTIRKVAHSSDWVQITKKKSESAKLPHFVKAWNECRKYESTQAK